MGWVSWTFDSGLVRQATWAGCLVVDGHRLGAQLPSEEWMRAIARLSGR